MPGPMISQRKTCASITTSVLLAASACFADTIFVTPGGPGGGANWGDATSLTNALASAADDDEIWVAAGVYTNGSDPSFTVSSDVTVYGGFTNGMLTLGERDWDTHSALLDGEGARRVMTISSDCTLDGLVITNGYAVDGSGVYANGAYTIAFRNSRFARNRMSTSSGAQGGALYLVGGSAVASNTVFADNGDDCSGHCGGGRDGEGIYANNQTLTITDCVFTNNRPLNTYASRGANGGAIYITGSSMGRMM